MSYYLLDTNHASPLVTKGHELRTRVQDAINAGHDFWIAAPALSELWFGLEMTLRRHRNLAEWEELEEEIHCLEIDEQDAKTGATMQATLRRRGRDLKTVDALIAAVALRYDLTLLTTDQDFNPVPGLKTENWIKRPPK